MSGYQSTKTSYATTESAFKSDNTASNKCGVTLMNNQVGAVVAEVMGQRAAALLVPDKDNLDAVARQQIDGGLIDARRQHLLGAALQQRDAAALLAERCENAARQGARRRQPARRQR